MTANETASLMSWILPVLNKKEGVHILNERVYACVCVCARVTPVASSRNSLAKPWKLLSQVTVFWIITIITGLWSMGELISFAHHIDMFNHTGLSFIITLKTPDLLQQRAKALRPKLLLPPNATWWVRLSQVFSKSLLLFFPSEWRWWWYEIPAVVVGRKQQSHQEAQFEEREREKSWSALSWEPERAVSAYSRRACSLNTTRWVWRPVPNQAKPEAYFPSSIWLKEEISLCVSCITSQTHHLFTWSHRGNAKYSQANLTSVKLNHL